MTAVKNGHEPVVRLLLRVGIHTSDPAWRRYFLQRARQEGYDAIVELLRSVGAVEFGAEKEVESTPFP
jgi:hypothetical protein